MSYLDNQGLQTLWNNVKRVIAAHTATVTSTYQSGIELASVDNSSIYIPTVCVPTQVTLQSANWPNNSIQVNVQNVTATNTVIFSPDPSSLSFWSANGVYCSSQSTGQLTFTCNTAPSVDLIANICVFITE